MDNIMGENQRQFTKWRYLHTSQNKTEKFATDIVFVFKTLDTLRVDEGNVEHNNAQRQFGFYSRRLADGPREPKKMALLDILIYGLLPAERAHNA
ncbi:hypothetical protein ElyMa_000672100 [Elysia marginata]|uniref:Uncharacterized protein n=1 Tax=Elysia marginata TaxID=1093978 RepID=A0AAV4GHA3_9GAST|nr:hypothetical protein ElyMa_000672100 [Elysia marginata]